MIWIKHTGGVLKDDFEGDLEGDVEGDSEGDVFKMHKLSLNVIK